MENDVEQAAILLLSMGEESAAEILKYMDQKQVAKIVEAMNSLASVTESNAVAALNNFLISSTDQTGLASHSKEFIRSSLTSAVGPGQAVNVLSSTLGEPSDGLTLLAWQSVRLIADTLKSEHPQVITIIFTYLDDEKAAKVLSILPKEMRSEIVKRLSEVGPISPIAIEDLASVMKSELSPDTNFKELPIGGIDSAASIVNYLSSDLENEIIESISNDNEELSIKIQERMFPFERLKELDDRSLQTLLRSISSDILVIALKGTDDALKERFYKNMSGRAAQILQDELDTLGPVQLSKVESAQKEIIAATQRMAKEGQIILSKGEGIVK